MQRDGIASNLVEILDELGKDRGRLASIAVKIFHSGSIRHIECHPVLSRLCAWGCVGNKAVWKLVVEFDVVRTENSKETIVNSRISKQNVFNLSINKLNGLVYRYMYLYKVCII